MEKNTVVVAPSNPTQYKAKPYQKKRYYTPYDVASHNNANNCWITLFHEVFDLTDLIQEFISQKESVPLIQAAGSDITHWFDSVTKNPRLKVDLNSGMQTYFCPQGEFIHVVKSTAQSIHKNQENSQVWWKNDKYKIGKLTQKVRKIKIINMLSEHEDIIEIPREETMNEILERYKSINDHAASYTWKRLGKSIDMEKTLEQNGIPDEKDEFDVLDIPEQDQYIPAIHLYFNDDLTIA